VGSTVTVTVAGEQPPVRVYEIVVVPAPIPPTMPEVPTVPTAVLLLLHTPPEEASLNVIVAPAQRENVPIITAGIGYTVTIIDTVPHPSVSVYAIVVVPAPMPVTTPDVEPTVPTLPLLLLHVPPVIASVNVVVAPGQT
jgi:hypothetical protein